jgi:hypothetical protein
MRCLFTWFRRAPRSSQPTTRRPSARRPLLEALEARDLLSTTLMTPAASSASGQAYTPAQIRHAYGFDRITLPGGQVGDGAGQTIAIVDAYDDPKLVGTKDPNFAQSDLARFDQYFNLPDPPSFVKVAQDGSAHYPATNPGWTAESALDVEWAHALAPKANIVLVEANDTANLFAATGYARTLPGVAVVSMSWMQHELLNETPYDTSVFATPAGHPGITFIAATGDNGSPGGFPAYSPNVLAVGGTVASIDASGNLRSESGWSGSGGGISTVEHQPAFQNGVVNAFSTTQRTIPDVSFEADGPGVRVYVSNPGPNLPGPWMAARGTSFATPAWAALIAIADQGRVSAGLGTLDGPSQTLPKLYQMPATCFNDVTTGSNRGYSAGAGYDLVTGRGTPKADQVTAYLARDTVTVLDGDLPVVPNSPRPAKLQDAARLFAHSAEHYTEFVIHAYQQYLKRVPDAAGLAAWVSGMQAGTYSDEQVEAFFLGSQEYIQTHGGTGQAWVTGMYQDLLGRTASPAEVQTWVNVLNNGTPASAVALGFAASRERESQRVRTNYQTYLGRTPRQDEVDLWVNAFVGGVTNEDMVAGFVGSLEYYQNPTKGRSNAAAWVAQAYRDVLFRAAGVGEINNWLQFLG